MYYAYCQIPTIFCCKEKLKRIHLYKIEILNALFMVIELFFYLLVNFFACQNALCKDFLLFLFKSCTICRILHDPRSPLFSCLGVTPTTLKTFPQTCRLFCCIAWIMHRIWAVPVTFLKKIWFLDKQLNNA